MLILFQGAPVAKVDNGVTYHFVGTWEERKGHELIWPATARGVPLVFQAVVEAQGVTIRRDWAIAAV
jgi:hypothetical protein